MPWYRVLRMAALALACGLPSGAEAQAPPPSCPVPRDSPTLRYDNARWGIAMTHPAAFALDPDSVPENGDSARFWTTDRRATAVVTALPNSGRQPLADLLEDAERDVLENSGGSITYRRVTADWFVLSGYVGERIYYRRSFLGRGGRVLATLWVEFPRGLRSCYETAVTTMSLSFRPTGP